MKRQSTLSIISILAILFFLSACSMGPGAAPQEVVVDPLRFTEEINAFKSADSAKRPLPNVVLFVGSSSIRGWKTLAKDIYEVNVLNRGFGGSHMSDLLYYIDDVVFAYRPNAILVYEGDNDIAAGKTPERVLTDYQTFVGKVHGEWSDMPIFFISIKPSLNRIGVIEEMAQANTLIKNYSDTNEHLYYIDVFNPMLGEDGKPRPDIFIEDGLHLNAAGYKIWTAEVKKELGLTE